MDIVTGTSKLSIVTHSEQETIFDLSSQGIDVLKSEDFREYNEETTLDLSNNCFHYIPKWISDLPITKLIVSYGALKPELFFEAGFRQDIVVEANGMGLKHPPQNLNHTQVKCEIDFMSFDYWEQFPQNGSMDCSFINPEIDCR